MYGLGLAVRLGAWALRTASSINRAYLRPRRRSRYGHTRRNEARVTAAVPGACGGRGERDARRRVRCHALTHLAPTVDVP